VSVLVAEVVAKRCSMKTSFKVSLSGVIGALSLVLMLLTSVIPFGTFAFPAFAGMLLISIVIELGNSWAFLVYFTVSTLSLLLLTDKEAALYYVIFLGFYPIVKGLIEKMLGTPASANILYHLDGSQLKHYTDDEIAKIYASH
jgi:hypothetical protein